MFSHILGSHPDICGYSELHTPYASKAQLVQTDKRLAEEQGYAQAKYLFDKLLHNAPVSYQLLTEKCVVPMVVVRKPERTIKSILTMGKKYTQGENKANFTNPEFVVNYYCNRLKWLVDFCTEAPCKPLFFEAENLIEQTETVLQLVTHYLKLNSPLSPEYQTFAKTGKTGHGDPSDYVKSGRLIARRDSYELQFVEPSLLAKAEGSFNDSYPLLKASCQV
ncbi:hypothetical protein K0504_06840 [Neiella marina]|uniref:Sulfotransferase n=1 Tax=Neiella holothuriorum TaxID=2870530 RepID=A0ABS7EET4_9GAMM|nr:hypothetical protein [Neiella holothuriorum]MBW8190745.1 hypothetical protein [Neiella holothuriorum]